MHNLLEQYLAEVAKGLGPLPVARRSEELHEIRQHLLHAVAVNQESGKSEDEALLATLEQFGTPVDLGQNLLMMWQRGEARLDKRSYWGAAVCAVVSLWVGGLLLASLAESHMNPDFQHMKNLEEIQAAQRALIWFGVAGVAMVILCGFVSGMAFPRKAVSGTGGGMTLLYAFSLCWQVFKYVHAGTDALHIFYSVVMLVLNGMAFSLLAVLGAWAGRKWRTTPTRLMCDDQ